MRNIFLLFIILLLSIHGISQKPEDKFTLVFYNAENLYDTIDSPGIDDKAYTPAGAKKWNSEKYRKKINDLSRVLSSMTDNELPEIIGLAEIENMRVLQDLVRHNNLLKGNYGIIHKDGPDPGGLDVALLYRKDEFTLSGYELIPVTFPFDSTLSTRDILHVYGRLKDEREVHFFVNHWNARDPGQRETETRRMYCAVALRRNIDLLLSRDSRARIVIMGDFNDEPTNKSLMSVLQASNKRKNITVGEFYNLMYDKHNLSAAGSCLQQGIMNMFDQIIISHNLLTAVGGYRCNYDSGHVFAKDWMTSQVREGVDAPLSTYSGNDYKGGPGSHLPVFLTFTK